MPSHKISSGLVIMLRHRAANYALALRNNASDRVTHELRTLLCDMLDPDVVMELTSAWLKQQETRAERSERQKSSRKERAA